MNSTQDVAGVGSDAVVQAIEAKVRAVRTTLPHARNGRPKAPSSRYVAQIGKDMQQGVSREVARLCAWLVCAVEDGVDHEIAEAPLLMMVALVRERARLRPERPVLVISRNETRAEAPLNLAQLRLAESPECAEALQAVADAADRYVPHVEELREACRAQLTVVRAHTSRPAHESRPARTPARRGHLQAMS